MLGIYYFLSDLGLKLEFQESWLAKFRMDEIGDNIGFYFIEFALDKPGRIDVGGIIALIWGPLIPDCFLSLLLFFANSQSRVFVFFLES